MSASAMIPTEHQNLVQGLTDRIADDRLLSEAAHAHAVRVTGISGPVETDKEEAYYAAYALFQMNVLAKVLANWVKLNA